MLTHLSPISPNSFCFAIVNTMSSRLVLNLRSMRISDGSGAESGLSASGVLSDNNDNNTLYSVSGPAVSYGGRDLRNPNRNVSRSRSRSRKTTSLVRRGAGGASGGERRGRIVISALGKTPRSPILSSTPIDFESDASDEELTTGEKVLGATRRRRRPTSIELYEMVGRGVTLARGNSGSDGSGGGLRGGGGATPVRVQVEVHVDVDMDTDADTTDAEYRDLENRRRMGPSPV